MAKRHEAKERRARAAQIQAAQRRAERRRAFLIITPAVVLAVALVGSAAFVVVNRQRQQDAADAAAQKPIDGVKNFPNLSRNHVQTPVQYPQTPAVGGNHNPVWVNCGTYTQPVDPTQAVHALEHGAVWIGYDPKLRQAEVDRLTRIADSNSYVLVSPVPGMSGPVSASAWGKQLIVDTPDDQRLAAFVTKYQESPNAPEPGAPCDGGAGGM